MSKKIKLELTEKEAEQLWQVVGNGYGDGDYYNVDPDTGKVEKNAGYGSELDHQAFLRALNKLNTARNA